MRGRVTQSGPSWTLDVRTWLYPALRHLGHWIWTASSDKSASWILTGGVAMTFHIPSPGICVHIFLLCTNTLLECYIYKAQSEKEMIRLENIWYEDQ